MPYRTSIFLVVMAATLAAADPAVNDTFFFQEKGTSALNGRSFQGAGWLRLDRQGGVTGQVFVKDSSGTTPLAASGRYAFQADGLGAMILRLAGRDQPEMASYRLALDASGRIAILRTDNGFLSEGQLAPAGGNATNVQGVFYVRETSTDSARQTVLSHGVWKFDGKGGVEAAVTVKNFYQLATVPLTGRAELQPDGTFDVRLSPAPVTTEDGWVLQPLAVAYKLIPGAKTFDLLRLDAGITSQIEVTAK